MKTFSVLMFTILEKKQTFIRKDKTDGDAMRWSLFSGNCFLQNQMLMSVAFSNVSKSNTEPGSMKNIYAGKCCLVKI